MAIHIWKHIENVSPSQFSAMNLDLNSSCKAIYRMIAEERNGTDLLGKCSISFTKQLGKHKIMNFWYKLSCSAALLLMVSVLIRCLGMCKLVIL